MSWRARAASRPQGVGLVGHAGAAQDLSQPCLQQVVGGRQEADMADMAAWQSLAAQRTKGDTVAQLQRQS